MSDGILLDVAAGVAVVTVRAPRTRNALTTDLASSLVEVCDEIDNDVAIGACVVRGDDGTFTSGAYRPTLEEIGEDPAGDKQYRTLGGIYDAFVRVGKLKVPVVAAVRGSVLGAGLNLMLAADLRVVADDAYIQAGFLRIGALPGGGHFVLSSRAFGREGAAALALFGEGLTGKEAAARGLAWRSLPDGEVEPHAVELAERAAADPELAREAVRGFREEIGPPSLSWEAAMMYERAPQMWSLRRRVSASEAPGETSG